ncbi:MAG: response regulator [Planctomycetota bacterium]
MDPQRTDLRRLLVLRTPGLAQSGVAELLRGYFDVEEVADVEQATEQMRKGRYDAVLAEAADFLPLERGLVTQRAQVVLDTIADGVCIVGPRGELVWANRRLREAPAGVLRSLQSICRGAYEQFASAGGEGDKRYSLKPDPGTYYEVICSPVRDGQGILRQVAAIVVDATGRRRQQLKLNAIDNAGRELVRLDDEQGAPRTVAERLKVLEERVIRYSRDVLDFEHFAVLLLDERTNRLELVVSEGLDEDTEKYELFASAEGNGICGYVAATARSYICQDVRKDPRYVKGLAGARSSLTVPLRMRDKVVGVLNVESARVGAFGEEDRQFAEIFANYVAVAMHMLNLVASERHEAQTQISGSISAELAGPLGDVISEATELAEDYLGHDDLRKRLNSIIDRAGAARTRLHELVSSPSPGVLSGEETRTAPKDPVLAGRRALVADDEEVIRNTLRDVLSSHGCEVDTVADGAEATQRLSEQAYDLVISDIKMPGASGYEVFAAAKQAGASTRVILMTAFGYDPEHSIVRANREGLSAVLFKPFKVNELLDECREALRCD